jgi:ATP/maltotriose-dependent transcriptional regulator MalT
MPRNHTLSDTPAELFTRRKRAILLHLEADKSYQDIAVLETLALNSVKWYVQQFYTRSGVSRRSAAVEQARQLGLLQPAPVLSPHPPRVKNNLPVPLTSFIGREHVIREVGRLLQAKDTRLLTLTGSGGTGKTRLALQATAQLLDAYPNGVWLVELVPLADPL